MTWKEKKLEELNEKIDKADMEYVEATSSLDRVFIVDRLRSYWIEKVLVEMDIYDGSTTQEL